MNLVLWVDVMNIAAVHTDKNFLELVLEEGKPISVNWSIAHNLISKRHVSSAFQFVNLGMNNTSYKFLGLDSSPHSISSTMFTQSRVDFKGAQQDVEGYIFFVL